MHKKLKKRILKEIKKNTCFTECNTQPFLAESDLLVLEIIGLSKIDDSFKNDFEDDSSFVATFRYVDSDTWSDQFDIIVPDKAIERYFSINDFAAHKAIIEKSLILQKFRIMLAKEQFNKTREDYLDDNFQDYNGVFRYKIPFSIFKNCFVAATWNP
ncbi:hypothetical protein [Butyrivibrio sp. NC2002]|uniref:hypothetical protein n=1 Tax=Butyrivibrio sp. NC2002 TaxID=1410610 RepID=UPI000564B258|nr:hypothetical protein [Butyrivibrio sp. NC2002]